MDAAERIGALREQVLARKGRERTRVERHEVCATARSLLASEGESSWQVRRGMLSRDRLVSVRFVVDDPELLAGRFDFEPPEVSQAEFDEASVYLRQYPPPMGQTGHCELDLEPIMRFGIDGLATEIRGRFDNAEGDAAEAYRSFLYALEGFSLFIENAANAGSGDLAESCRRVAHGPPESFRDAIQLLWLVTLGVMHGDQVGLVVPGHLDGTLAPFYEVDRASGTLTQEDALELVESLYLLVNDYIPDGLAMSVMVGGRDADGNDVTNELSYLCLEALRRTNMIYPTVGICWHEGTPSNLVELAVELIGHGYPTPALFGDETIQRGLKALGVPADEACRYINSTCVEITPSCSSNVWVASPYFPICALLLDEIADQADADGPAETFDAFRRKYFDRLADLIALGVDNENEGRRHRREFGRKPLQSVFTRDCIARGRDIDDGGAVYNWVECSFVGLANLADSLHVIWREVFEEKRMSLAELKAVLDAGFDGFEPVRRRFLDGHAKYGQGCAEVDALFGEVVAFVREECSKHRMEPDDSPFVPGGFCWIMHEVLGRECGATPDGRKAGAAFADGCGPAQGREKLGPTAAILSTTSWDHSPMIGGLAYNMKFNRSFFDGPEGFARLQDLLQAFLRQGGFETQVNVVDAETLRQAREQPEAHRDLIVRIGGYCDYFARLSTEMQDEIILRTEFDRV